MSPGTCGQFFTPEQSNGSSGCCPSQDQRGFGLDPNGDPTWLLCKLLLLLIRQQGASQVPRPHCSVCLQGGFIQDGHGIWVLLKGYDKMDGLYHNAPKPQGALGRKDILMLSLGRPTQLFPVLLPGSSLCSSLAKWQGLRGWAVKGHLRPQQSPKQLGLQPCNLTRRF